MMDVGPLRPERSDSEATRDTLRCALVGPRGAGKKTLLEALCVDDDGVARSRPHWRVRGPSVAPSGETCVPVERASLTSRVGLRRRRRMLDVRRNDLDGFIDDAALERSDCVLLCLDVGGARKPGPAANAVRVALLSYVGALSGDPSRRAPPVVLCLTKYERFFTDEGAPALSLAGDPGVAAQLFDWTLSEKGPYGYLRASLAALDEAGRKLWLQPVSSFGFVAGHGGANVTPDGDRRRTDWARELAERRDARQGERGWRPFLVQDPFALAAFGEPGAVTLSWRQAMG